MPKIVKISDAIKKLTKLVNYINFAISSLLLRLKKAGETSSLRRQDKKKLRKWCEEKTREAETKLDSRKDSSPIIQGLSSVVRRMSRNTPIANVTTVQTRRRFSRLITLETVSFQSILNPSSFLYFARPYALLSTLQNSHVLF